MNPTYQVKFFKRLADSTGHTADVEQGRVEVSSSTAKPSVLDDAKRWFAQVCGVADWRHRADYAQTTELPFEPPKPTQPQIEISRSVLHRIRPSLTKRNR